MIEARGLEKRFGSVSALHDVSLQIRDREVFGLVGTNGAGKSTFLRILAGVLRQDAGTVSVDGDPLSDDPEVRGRVFFVPDDPYYFPGATPDTMAAFFAGQYAGFDRQLFAKMADDLGLDRHRRVDTFSKGMKKQLTLLLGLSSGTKYILCDETFDGLDPVMRQGMKSVFARFMEDRGLTPVLTSHNLRELEDICDHMGLLHEGGVILSEDITAMKLGVQKVQCVFQPGIDPDRALEGLSVLVREQRGRLLTLTVRGTREEMEDHFSRQQTIFCEVLSPSLEEIFITETEVAGYDVKKIILG